MTFISGRSFLNFEITSWFVAPVSQLITQHRIPCFSRWSSMLVWVSLHLVKTTTLQSSGRSPFSFASRFESHDNFDVVPTRCATLRISLIMPGSRVLFCTMCSSREMSASGLLMSDCSIQICTSLFIFSIFLDVTLMSSISEWLGATRCSWMTRSGKRRFASHLRTLDMYP